MNMYRFKDLPKEGWIKINCPARYGSIKGWRKIRGVKEFSENRYFVVRAAGYDDFYVKEHEVEEYSLKKPLIDEKILQIKP